MVTRDGYHVYQGSSVSYTSVAQFPRTILIDSAPPPPPKRMMGHGYHFGDQFVNQLMVNHSRVLCLDFQYNFVFVGYMLYWPSPN